MPTELLFRGDAYLKTALAQVTAVHERGVELDRTIFYPTGGGQMGDTGVLLRANGERIAIADTRKGDGVDSVMHFAAAPVPPLQIGEALTLEIDWQRRYALMRLHTALHVMSCVVVAPVTGGNISPEKARLDFDIDMSLLDATRIEQETNALIARGVDTETVWITDEELRRPAGAGQDHERAAAARRRAAFGYSRYPASTCNPVAARTCGTSRKSAASACSGSEAKANATSASRLHSRRDRRWWVVQGRRYDRFLLSSSDLRFANGEWVAPV